MKPVVAPRLILSFLSFACISFAAASAPAKNPIRTDFFARYPAAVGTPIETVPSNANHCGMCHFNFDGGGPRNAYGAAVEAKRNLGKTNAQAFAELESVDTDNDGYSSLVEITSALFSNTPTFPGLKLSDVGSLSMVNTPDVTPYLTPTTGIDTTPPTVALTSPNGGQTYAAHSLQNVTWTASDASGIAGIRIDASYDGGTTFETVAENEANDGTFSWFVPNMPGSARIRVVAADNAGNYGTDRSNAPFIVTQAPGLTTLRDMKLPGSQPFSAAVEDPAANCVTCHGNYNTLVEPWSNWKGSMMAQAMRDPLFLACLAVAEQDAPSVGDLCLRCHTPGGWVEGRSVDTRGGMLTAKDRQGVQCDFCHRQVDPVYTPGVSPVADVAVFDSLGTAPFTYGNGQFVIDPNSPPRRGPFADAISSHSFLYSPVHRSANVCGTCHDVSNPVFENAGAPGKYAPGTLNAPHPDGNLRNMFPVERTFSEWTQTEYAATGVYAPQFAGNKAGGIVSTCQDCHMADVAGTGCNEPGAPTRSDLPLHDLTGGNTFIPDIIPTFFPGEVDVAQLNAGKQRATSMLQLAASMAVATGQTGPNPTLTVTVTNETAHKLPSGYPEGRRIWLNVKAWDEEDNLVYESGAYNAATGELSHDADAKIYEIKIGISSRLAPVLGMPAAPSFHFVLNDTVYQDNRIPPRGFTNTAFETIQSPPVGHAYADGQHWDETLYTLPTEARYAEVRLYYQTTSKEYIEFLRDANTTNTAGLDLYNAWVANGRGAPVLMEFDVVNVVVNPTGIGDGPTVRTELLPNVPNPFNPSTTVRFALSKRQHVRIDVFDVSGARVVNLIDEVRPAGVQSIVWNGGDSGDRYVASGVYFIKMSTAEGSFVRKAVLLK